VDNDNLYIFKNIYEQQGKETFILLNLPQDKDVFNDFITSTYKPVPTSQHGIMDYTNSFRFNSIYQALNLNTIRKGFYFALICEKENNNLITLINPRK
jgi:hypothetical protein